MSEIDTIVVALDKAHQAWRARGIQSRPLLSLLLQFDAGRSLDIASRQRISADVALFSSTLQPATDRPDIVPDVLPEILLLAGDLDPDAPSLLANSLWIKYRRSVDWAWKVWDNTVASLRQVPVMTSDEVGRRNCALRYGILLWHVDQHLAMGLDSEIFRWFTGPGRSEIAALSSEAWDVLIIVLLYLSIHGALKTTTILQGLVYPAWQQAAKSDQPSPALETSLRSANDICRRLLLSDEINHDLPPVDLLELQSIRTRRQEVYSEAHFPLLASTIPVLISLQNNHHISEQIRVDSTSLRHTISQNSDFRQGAYRNLDAIREAFERSLHPSDSPGGILNKHIVAGLRLLLYDLNVGDELSEWPTVTSMLSPWKIAATMVQMQLILKEMGQELLRDPQSSSAHSNLDRLISMLLNHSMSSEQATYVGEMARGVDNVVAEKFIENGIRCITESLVDSTPTTSTLSAPFQRAGELLRVMIYVSGPLREDVTNSFTLDPFVQDAFVAALLSRLTAMEPMMTSLGTEDIGFTQDIVIFLRLLQFQLNFGSSLSPQSKDATGRILSSLFKLSIYISSNDPNSILYPLILDTIYYLYDEMPLDSKATPYDPFCPYLDATLADLLAALPREHHKQLSSLLPLLPDTSAVANLVNSQRDASGNMIYGAPVVNRSWEWIENLGEPTILDANEEDRDRGEKERFESRYAVKNSSSLSLEVFGARFTGDGVLRNSNTDQDYRRLGKLRGFGDGLSAENLFNRDWRETRVDLDPDGSNPGIHQQRPNEGNEQVGSSSYSGVSQPEKRPTPRGSPAPSNVSRGSTSSKGVLNRNSSSTISEIIDVDSATTVTSKQSSPNKRKASAVSDDEIEIIENPIPAQPSKKAKGKSVGKSKKR
ncbi:hypothetical protein H0H93_007925 [Arthromyces matolae]|nr:hypothetical protein H0H93_007925 [Arthromyces matolae]